MQPGMLLKSLPSLSDFSAATVLQQDPSPPEPALTGAAVSLSALGTALSEPQKPSYCWGASAFSSCCLNTSSNKKLTPSQSSHDPRADKLEKTF